VGISDGDAIYASEARRRGLKIKFVRRTVRKLSGAIDLVSSGRVNVRAPGELPEPQKFGGKIAQGV
jgi:hypothetical protein